MFAKTKLLAIVAAALCVVDASPLNNKPPVASVTSFIPGAVPTRTCGTTNTITLTIPYGAPISSGAVPSGWPEPSGSWGWPEPSGSWSWPEPSGSWSWPEPSGSWSWPEPSGSWSWPEPSNLPSGSASVSVRPTAFPSGSFSYPGPRPTGYPGYPYPSAIESSYAWPYPSGQPEYSSGIYYPSGSVESSYAWPYPSDSPEPSGGSASGSVRPTAFPSGSFSYPGPRPTGYPGYPYPSAIESSYAWPYPSGQPEYSSGIYYPEPSSGIFYPSGIASSATPSLTQPGVTNTYPSGTWSPDCSVVVTVTQHLPGPSGPPSGRPYAPPRPTAF